MLRWRTAGAKEIRRSGLEAFTQAIRQSSPKGFSALITKLLVHASKPSSGFQRKVRTPDQTLAAGIALICAFAAMGPLATNIFLPSLPTIAADLQVSSAVVTSTISVFLAIVAVGQLIVGPLSDRVGRRTPILAGLCIFVVGTTWCAFAGDLANMLVGRSIQASGACATLVLSRAIARDLFDGQALAKVMALTTIATAAAPGFSPLLGSALDHFFGWRSEFVFVAIFASALCWRIQRWSAKPIVPLAAP